MADGKDRLGDDGKQELEEQVVGLGDGTDE
jgi:hypothetical protein